MIDPFIIILTPILLLGVIVLLSFVGCHAMLSDPVVVPVSSISPASGSPEGGTVVTPVTIMGSGFVKGATVTFGAAAALARVDNDTSISVVPPAHSRGTVDVVVSDPDNTGGVLRRGYTYGVHHLEQPHPNYEDHASAGNNSLSVTIPDYSGTGKRLIVVTVQWGGAATLTLSGAPFMPLEVDTLQQVLAAELVQVATYYASDVSNAIVITANLSAPSTTDFNLRAFAYDGADPASTPDHLSREELTGTSVMLTFQPDKLQEGDLVYAVAVARNATGVLSGALSADPSFTADIAGGYLLVEDRVLANVGVIPVSAINSSGDPTSPLYLFAMLIKAPQ